MEGCPHIASRNPMLARGRGGLRVSYKPNRSLKGNTWKARVLQWDAWLLQGRSDNRREILTNALAGKKVSNETYI